MSFNVQAQLGGGIEVYAVGKAKVFGRIAADMVSKVFLYIGEYLCAFVKWQIAKVVVIDLKAVEAIEVIAHIFAVECQALIAQAVAYLRKSTTKQNQKNSYERQTANIERWAASNNFQIQTYYQEAVSGKYGLSQRPELQAAFDSGLPVVVSSIDRLSRDVATGAAILQDKKVIVANLGLQVDALVQNLLLCVSAAEREMISSRVKEGMKKAKERGQKFGNPNINKINHLGHKANRAKGKATMQRYAPMIQKARQAGCVSSRDIADYLNEFGVRSPRGKDISQRLVARLLRKMEE